MISLFLYDELIAKLKALTSVTQVSEVQGKLPSLSSRHITQSDTLGTIVGITIKANADIGAFHLLGTVAKSMHSCLEILRFLFALVRVVALSTKEEEAVAPATRRFVNADTKVSASVAVAERIVKLSPVLSVLVRVAL